MSMINPTDPGNIPVNPADPKIDGVGGVEKIDPLEQQKFKELIGEEKKAESADEVLNGDEMTLAELQKQIRDSIMKKGLEDSIKKAREIAKELREG